MSLIEDIRKDREAGTPGLWRTDVDYLSEGWRPGVTSQMGVAVVWCTDIHEEGIQHAPDARRIARVPTMENRILSDAKKLLAAEELAEALESRSPFTGQLSGGDITAKLNAYREATKS